MTGWGNGVGKSWEGGLVALDVAACFMILGMLLIVEIFKKF